MAWIAPDFPVGVLGPLGPNVCLGRNKVADVVATNGHTT